MPLCSPAWHSLRAIRSRGADRCPIAGRPSMDSLTETLQYSRTFELAEIRNFNGIPSRAQKGPSVEKHDGGEFRLDPVHWSTRYGFAVTLRKTHRWITQRRGTRKCAIGRRSSKHRSWATCLTCAGLSSSRTATRSAGALIASTLVTPRLRSKRALLNPSDE